MSYVSINQNLEFVCLSENDDWKYQLPIEKKLAVLLNGCNCCDDYLTSFLIKIVMKFEKIMFHQDHLE